MSVYLRILSFDGSYAVGDITPITFEYTEKLSQSGEWSASIPLSEISFDNLEEGQRIYAYEEDTLIVEGAISAKRIEFSNDQLTVFIQGRDILDDLYTSRSSGDVFFHNPIEARSLISHSLFEADWLLGDISTFESRDVSTIIDTPLQNSVISEILEIIGKLPKTFYRLGSKILGKNSLDIGEFGEVSEEVIVSQTPEEGLIRDGRKYKQVLATSMSKENNISGVLSSIEAYGANFTNSVGDEVTLSLANDSNRLVNHFQGENFENQYIIVQKTIANKYVVVNRLHKVGGTIVEMLFNEYVPSPPPPDPAPTDFKIGNPGTSDNHWYACRFAPFPGKLSRIKLLVEPGLFGAPPAVTEDLTVKIYQGGHYITDPDNLAVNTNNEIWSGSIDVTDVTLKSYKTIYITDGPELEAGYTYWLAAGFETPQPAGSFVEWTNNGGQTSTPIRAVAWTDGDDPDNYDSGVYNTWSCYFDVSTEPISYSYPIHTKKVFSNIKPDLTVASGGSLAVEECADFLFKSCIAELTNFSKASSLYTLSLSDKLNTKVGDKVKVKGSWVSSIFNHATGEIYTAPLHIDDTFRIEEKTTSWQGDIISFSATITDAEGIIVRDNPLLELYDSIPLDTTVDFQRVAVNSRSFMIDEELILQSNITGEPDTTMSDGSLGLLVEVPKPTLVGLLTETRIILIAGLPVCSTTAGDKVQVELVQLPDIFDPDIKLQFKVSIEGRDWSDSDILSYEIMYAIY